ncbi:hypothetical protein C2134_01045 [Chromobacterium sinusclupearum]|jgi:hypothetical protein|uniref:Uncharacterized protein n=1 Tax=Chromobacterium sinusclupearum TaxID=2077146 RepID=A0A2K4MTS3_9NEIS|nr:hypothetical protein C2134_01045 [Chromobacterium sinusclupearum]
MPLDLLKSQRRGMFRFRHLDCAPWACRQPQNRDAGTQYKKKLAHGRVVMIAAMDAGKGRT